MTDTESGLQDPAASSGPLSADAEARFIKSLIPVLKDNRDVLSRLPELMEQCLNNEPLNSDLAESRPKEENRKSVESELSKKDKLLEESERTAICVEEECLKLKKELEKKEKETSETGKVQEEKCLKLLKELEKKNKEISETSKIQEERLLNKEDELQRLYGEYDKALKSHKSSHDNMIDELAAKDKAIEKYKQSLSKTEEELRNAHAKVDHYKSRLASISEKRVKQDQRSVEDTLSLNRQSALERDFSKFFDGERMDVCVKMESIYQKNDYNFVYIYYPRLACIIFETAYEQVKETKEAATDVFQEFIKMMINYAPYMGRDYSKARKEQLEVWNVPALNISTRSDGTECSKDVKDGMMLSLKEAAPTCNLDYLVQSVLEMTYEKWNNWFFEDKSCSFTPDWNLIKSFDKYINACIRLTWRMVTQVPPMKLEFHSSRFSKDIHKEMEYHGSVERRSRNSQPAHQDQGEEIACYLWPGLQDGGGRLIKAGAVICKAKKP